MSNVIHFEPNSPAAMLVDAPPLIPAGEYDAIYLFHETAYSYKTARVFVHFKLQDGPYHGAKLYSSYRVHSFSGKPRKNGVFKIRHSHDLFREFVAMSGAKERPDRISLRRLKGCLLKVRVRTVVRDYRQRPLTPAQQYSIVGEMLSVEAGSLK